MAKRQLPSPEVLRQLLSYDHETGKLFWKERGPEMFSSESGRVLNACSIWNSRYAGKEALTAIDPKGYLRGSVLGIGISAHRVAWAIHYCQWPDTIDHINGIKTDNRLVNLRSVSVAENQRNQKTHSSNTSGHRGVYANSRGWTAQIKVDRKARHLGHFRSFGEAVAARVRAEARFGFHENHGRPE